MAGSEFGFYKPTTEERVERLENSFPELYKKVQIATILIMLSPVIGGILGMVGMTIYLEYLK